MEITMVMRSWNRKPGQTGRWNGWATIRSRSMTNMISKSWAVIPTSNSITNGFRHRTVIFLPMLSYIIISKVASTKRWTAVWVWNLIRKKKKRLHFWDVSTIIGMMYSCLPDLCVMKVTPNLVKTISGGFSRRHPLLGACPNCRCSKTVLPLTIWNFVFRMVWPDVPDSTVIRHKLNILDTGSIIVIPTASLSWDMDRATTRTMTWLGKNKSLTI